MDLTTARTNLKARSRLGWVRDEVFPAYNRRVAGVQNQVVTASTTR